MNEAPNAEGLRLCDVALRFDPEAFVIMRRDDAPRLAGRRDILDWLNGGSRKAGGDE